jgi:hypothetical protein
MSLRGGEAEATFPAQESNVSHQLKVQLQNVFGISGILIRKHFIKLDG